MKVFEHEGDMIDVLHENLSNCGLQIQLEWKLEAGQPT